VINLGSLSGICGQLLGLRIDLKILTVFSSLVAVGRSCEFSQARGSYCGKLDRRQAL
jgi:hypothetical protein